MFTTYQGTSQVKQGTSSHTTSSLFGHKGYKLLMDSSQQEYGQLSYSVINSTVTCHITI